MRWRPLVVTATVGLVVAVWGSPAMAKGPDQATITGPGLDEPIVVTGYGEPGSGSELGDLADGSGLFLVMFGTGDRRVVSEAPDGPLGPKFELAFRVPDGTDSAPSVLQELYPYAAGGPVTFTKADQAIYGMRTSGGWYRTPARFSRLLEQLGVPAAAQLPAEPIVAPEPADPTAPTVPALTIVAAAAAVLAGVAFGWWRAHTRRSRHPAVGQHGLSAG